MNTMLGGAGENLPLAILRRSVMTTQKLKRSRMTEQDIRYLSEAVTAELWGNPVNGFRIRLIRPSGKAFVLSVKYLSSKAALKMLRRYRPINSLLEIVFKP